ncbi:hypothetical protein SEUCBS139899_000175 [Sporothrix eucalyptigena]
MLLSLSPPVAGYPRWGRDVHSTTASSSSTSANEAAVLSRRDVNPSDFSWIKRWAAIGDSFTAGIGSGNQMGTLLTPDWYCSRYSYSYAKILNYAFGPSVQDFQFTACSGDRSTQIYDQATSLKGPLDLVMLTAGGNDLCLATIITNCILLAWRGEDACQSVLDKAQENIDTILKDNVRAILNALNDGGAVRAGGFVVYSGYAPYFDTTNEDCGDLSKQNWAINEWWWWSYWFSSPLQLTVARRTTFNTLVANINKAIADVVAEFAANPAITYKIGFSNWADWGAAVDGQMCSPNGNGLYPEPNQPNLQFFKRDTYVAPSTFLELKKRGNETTNLRTDSTYTRETVDNDPELRVAVEQAIGGPLTEAARQHFLDRLAERWSMANLHESLLYKSPNPRAVALHRLDPRGTPSPPNCPGDDSFDPTLGLGLPDKLAANFHPNEKGHENMAAFAMTSLVDLRAKSLGQDAPLCTLGDADTFTCWQGTGRKSFASSDRMNANYPDFCDTVDATHPTNSINWVQRKTYHAGTPDEHEMVVQLGQGAATFNKSQCLDSLSRIINGCDGNDPDHNPLDFKFGGSYVRDEGRYTYEVNPKHDRTLVKATTGDCEGNYKFLFGSYTLRGTGWAGYDYGADTLLPAAKSCVGGGITNWQFSYCLDGNTKDCGGYEWKAIFRTPIWVRTRCFNNDKVQKKAGGSTNGVNWGSVGCSGSD